jgi:hypothetical protein
LIFRNPETHQLLSAHQHVFLIDKYSIKTTKQKRIIKEWGTILIDKYKRGPKRLLCCLEQLAQEILSFENTDYQCHLVWGKASSDRIRGSIAIAHLPINS